MATLKDIERGARVQYWDGRHTRQGIVIDIIEFSQRARVKWEDNHYIGQNNRPRTWIRISALSVIAPSQKTIL